MDKCFVFKLFNGVHVHCFGGNTAVVVRIKLNSVAKLVETHLIVTWSLYKLEKKLWQVFFILLLLEQLLLM